MKMFAGLARAMHRRSLKRRIEDWGNRIEQLDSQKRNHDGNMELAVTEMQKAKRELAALDLPPARVGAARGPGQRDGVRRFTLVQDRPTAGRA